MDDYFDKDKFTGRAGGQGKTPPPPRPPQRPPQQNNAGWYSWPVIIILFSLGIWPVALVLLFLNIFGDSSRRRNPSGGNRQSSAAHQVGSAVERAMRSAEARADRAADKTDQAIRRAAAQVERTIDRTVRQAEQADRAADKTDQAIRRAAAQVEQAIDRTVRQVEQARRAAPPPPKPAPKAAKKAKPVKTKSAGVLLRILGAIFLFGGGMATMDFAASVFQGYSAYLEDFFAGLGFMISGGVMFFRGHYLNKMSRRSQRYILAIGNVDAMPLEEIAKRVNRTPAKAAKELQKLIDKGYLGEDAYIDHERGYFLRFGATLEEEPEPVRETAPEPRETQEGYSGVLRSIRRANDRIADPVLSRKIDRLEQISGLIFKEVEEHPEKRNSIRTFFDYYLPTTQKLLDTYADFEETGVEGEHLRQAKERIEQTMDMIVDGFEHQLDQLYSSDAMDVVSDIQVMEAMLNRDTASAAKDFGYDPPPRVRPKADSEAEEDGGITLQL